MSCYGPIPGESKLPELPSNFEWVVTAQADRFTVNLAYQGVGEGYVGSHAHKHAVVISRGEWEEAVVNAAKALWVQYCESNNHARWADEIMRRSR